jgi:hypothetical protein
MHFCWRRRRAGLCKGVFASFFCLFFYTLQFINKYRRVLKYIYYACV